MPSLPLLLTAEQDCSYLPGRVARSLVAAADPIMCTELYSRFVQIGFRRSGDTIYRPHCAACAACLPIRVPVAQFRPDRTQRRNLKTNADLIAAPLRTGLQAEHHALFQRYLRRRHPDSDMVDTSAEDYQAFLGSGWCDTGFIEFRTPQQLAAVAVVDKLMDGLSAVYTFYEPELEPRGLGNYAVLWQIAQARALRLDYIYLGYWIAECRKMAYKNRFRPFEVFLNNDWVNGAAIHHEQHEESA